MSILKTMQESPYAWAILSLITIVSLLFGIYSWVSGKKFQRLTCTRKTNKLISLKNVAVDSLHLFFNKEEIMDVSITRFAVWNSGNERIDSKDIVASRMLRTGLKEGHKKDSRILNCSIDYVTDETIFGDINPDEIEYTSDTYSIPIDYLAPSDGMIIQIIHTGESTDLYMDCHIKGGKEFVEVSNDGLPIIQKNKNWRNRPFITSPLFSIGASFLVGILVAFPLNYYYSKIEATTIGLRIFTLFSLLLVLGSALLVVTVPYLFYGIKIPRELEQKL